MDAAPVEQAPADALPPDTRRPRDAQRRRVYLAETPLPSRRLADLAACEAYAARVVGSLWWLARFPQHDLGALPRFRPGHGARQAFFREDPDGPTITLPRRYRTTEVVLHELVHWALSGEHDLAAHGPTFARVLLDALTEFAGDATAGTLAAAFAEQGVRIGAPGRVGPDGRLRYGWDERLDRARGARVHVRFRRGSEPDATTCGVVVGAAGRGSTRSVRLRDAAGETRVRLADVWHVALA